MSTLDRVDLINPQVRPRVWRDDQMFEALCRDTEDFPANLPSESESEWEKIMIEIANTRRRRLSNRREFFKLQVRHAIDDRIERDKESHEYLIGSTEHGDEARQDLWHGRTEALRREELEANQHIIEDDLTPEGRELQPHIIEGTWERWERSRRHIEGWVREAMESSRPTPVGDLQRWAEPVRQANVLEVLRSARRSARRRPRAEFEAGPDVGAERAAHRRNPIMGRVIDLEDESDPEGQDGD
jgi:hypothetical protein